MTMALASMNISSLLTPQTVFALPSDVFHSSGLPSSRSESRIFRASLAVIGLVWAILFSFNRLTWLLFNNQQRSKKLSKVPPTLPHIIPFVGNAIEFMLNPSRWLSMAGQQAGPQAVYGLKLLHYKLYFLYKPENIAQIWKYRTSVTTPGVTAFFSRSVAGMSPEAVNMYSADDSGLLEKPMANTHVSSRNRIDRLTHVNFHNHLLGEGLPKLYRNFSTAFCNRLESLDVQTAWQEIPDIMSFWLVPLTSSINEALAGPQLELLNPSFTHDLLRYFPYVHPMMKGLPRWWIPAGYRLREKLVQNVKRWHAVARSQFKETDINREGNDPWWGSSFVRERQKILEQVDNWDDGSIASSDFGLFWGANVNVNPMAIWNIIEVFKDKELLRRVRGELAAADFDGITSTQQLNKLLSLPLLQSIHAEVLRLRVEVQTVFTSNQEDIRINEWRFPRSSLVLVPAGAAHRDINFWNTKDGKYPLKRFWADRFLVYPNDPHSGPRRSHVTKTDGIPCVKVKSGNESTTPKYISSGLANSFIPFGLGERICPGRAFARRIIVAFCAMVVHQYDIEILSNEEEFAMNPAFYGLGTQRPINKIPFKIRKRQVETDST